MTEAPQSPGEAGRLTYSVQREEFVAGLEAVVGSIMKTDMHRKWARRLEIFPYVLIGLLVACTLFLMYFFPYLWREISILVIVFLLAIVAACLFLGTAQKAQLGGTYDPRRNHDLTVAFERDGAHCIGREHRHAWNWSSLQRFHELPGIYVLEFAGYEMLIVPRRVFPSAREAYDWAARIRDRLPDAT